MRRNIHISLLAAMSMMLTVLLSGCGSDNKEGASAAANVPRVDEATCRVCHAASIDPYSQREIVPDFLNSPHNIPDDIHGCQGCHGGGAQHNGVGPIPFPNPAAAGICITCHVHADTAPAVTAPANATTEQLAAFTGNCAHCHNFHLGQVTPTSCIACHDVAAPQHGKNLVGDNSGVRAIVAEFSKWSHHVTGVNLQDAHCAACHLEGKVQDTVDGPVIVVDTTYHMADAKTHLRNADTDADMQWDPNAPNHTTMDNFCMSCHDANGAVSPASTAIRAVMLPAAGKTASALNPFGDTISNRYDKMQRPAVVDVSTQFNITNNSQHGVKGPRYSGRTRFAGNPRTINNPLSPTGTPATFALNSSAILQGVRSTIYDAGNFNQLYVPLANAGGETAPRTGAQTLGDDSTLHCGDCHTVGQWKPGVATNAKGVLNTVAIGAHGSNNEYLLRNSIGTDQRHTQNAYLKDTVTGVVTYTNPNGAFLVCYNCHAYAEYGSILFRTGGLGGHVGEYDQQGRCNGIGNTLPFNGYTTGTATDGTQFVSRFMGPISKYSSPAPYPGEQDPDFGNVFGIQCANCHNSGNGNTYGGIHGSANNGTLPGYVNDPSVTGGSYIDGAGNTTKIIRFLPGLGDSNHVPGNLGGITGGGTATFLRYSANAAKTVYTSLPVRSNLTTTGVAPAKLGSYNYTTRGVTNDTNWEQKHWQQAAGTVINPATGVITPGTAAASGAGCYTLGNSVEETPGWPEAQQGKLDQFGNVIAVRPSVNEGLTGGSQDGGATTPLMLGNWGGCDDHGSPVGGGRYGFFKKIVRPVTY